MSDGVIERYKPDKDPACANKVEAPSNMADGCYIELGNFFASSLKDTFSEVCLKGNQL